jgi:hypothetical protein
MAVCDTVIGRNAQQLSDQLCRSSRSKNPTCTLMELTLLFRNGFVLGISCHLLIDCSLLIFAREAV